MGRYASNGPCWTRKFSEPEQYSSSYVRWTQNHHASSHHIIQLAPNLPPYPSNHLSLSSETRLQQAPIGCASASVAMAPTPSPPCHHSTLSPLLPHLLWQASSNQPRRTPVEPLLVTSPASSDREVPMTPSMPCHHHARLHRISIV